MIEIWPFYDASSEKSLYNYSQETDSVLRNEIWPPQPLLNVLITVGAEYGCLPSSNAPSSYRE